MWWLKLFVWLNHSTLQGAKVAKKEEEEDEEDEEEEEEEEEKLAGKGKKRPAPSSTGAAKKVGLDQPFFFFLVYNMHMWIIAN